MASRFLLDENLSPRLTALLSEPFPGSKHVCDVHPKTATRSSAKVIWLVVGNTSTAEILRILLAHTTAIEAFINEPLTSLLTLRKL